MDDFFCATDRGGGGEIFSGFQYAHTCELHKLKTFF